MENRFRQPQPNKSRSRPLVARLQTSLEIVQGGDRVSIRQEVRFEDIITHQQWWQW